MSILAKAELPILRQVVTVWGEEQEMGVTRAEPSSRLSLRMRPEMRPRRIAATARRERERERERERDFWGFAI
jgi:hypothetical protein